MKRVLVTGASGFIGKNIVNVLLKNDFYVVAACRNEPDFKEIAKTSKYEWQYLDLTKEAIDFDKYFKDIDVVIHLAAQVHQMKIKSNDDVKKYQDLNVNKTVLLAANAKKNNVNLFIFMSSVKVLGEKTVCDQFSSSYKPAPVDPYGESKLDAENRLINICKDSYMKYIVIRTPLVYGPGVKANFLRMLGFISKGYPLPLKSIKNKRSLIYVENLADVILLCIKNKKAENNIYMVKDVDISTPELIRAISNCFNKNVYLFSIPVFFLKFVFNILGKREQINRLTDSLIVNDEHIREELNWSPVYNFNEAIEKTVNWYKTKNCNE